MSPLALSTDKQYNWPMEYPVIRLLYPDPNHIHPSYPTVFTKVSRRRIPTRLNLIIVTQAPICI